ncbi:MAG TPA: FAD-dependent oxidoreductase, partial [Abditibacteriaceae bacterium]
MMTDNGKTQSSWMATAEVPSAPILTQSLTVDVCIVGAGIAGLTTAYLLTKEGKSVVVLDDGPIAGGESARTTAHLASEIDDYYYEIERIHGEDGAKLAYSSHSTAIDTIEQIVAAEKIDCEFERLDGYLFLAPGESQDTLDNELEAATRAGFADVEKLDSVPLAGFESVPALRFPRQGQFHPLKYFAALAEAIKRNGGRIFTGTRVSKIENGAPAFIETSDGHRVEATAVVVATNTPINDLVKIHTKQHPYRTYVIGARIPKDSVAKALYWDTLDPYHYVRIQNGDDHDILIVGGEDHKT